MGIRLHTAIGWGLTYADFERLCLLEPTNDDKLDAAQTLIANTPASKLEVPKEVWSEAFYGSGPPMFEWALKSATYVRPSPDLQAYTPDGDPCHLLTSTYVFEPQEGIGHVIFFPSCYHGKKWHRHNDDLDYALARWANGSDPEANGDMSTDIRFVAYGHYPWTNFIMQRDGTPVAWDGPMMLKWRPELVPAVPTEIRWWTKELGILDNTGVNSLRPIVAKWWS
jgi:hypothetical protein